MNYKNFFNCGNHLGENCQNPMVILIFPIVTALATIVYIRKFFLFTIWLFEKLPNDTPLRSLDCFCFKITADPIRLSVR